MDKDITAGEDFVRFMRLNNFRHTHGELIEQIKLCNSRREIMALVHPYRHNGLH